VSRYFHYLEGMKPGMFNIYPCRNCGHDKPEIVAWFIKGTANRIHYRVQCPKCGYRLREPYEFKGPTKAVYFWNNNYLGGEEAR